VTQKEQMVQCGVLTDVGQNLEESSGYSDTEPADEYCKVLKDNGETVEGSSGHSDTEPTDSSM